MSHGERAALEGLVAQIAPDLAIEIGTAEGGSLERIAAHSGEVHSIDLSYENLARRPENAVLHEGDSGAVLPELLAALSADGRNVDFALVDGDHSEAGARNDLQALLDSPAVGRTLILLHDSFDADVRQGIRSVGLAEHPKVAGFDLDFVPGRVGKLGAFAGQLLGGFALVIVDDGSAEPVVGAELGLWSLQPDSILFHDCHETLGPR